MGCCTKKTLWDYFHLFCQNSSIQCLGRLTKPDYSPWLRFLWVFFIVLMIAILTNSTTEMTSEYLAYNTFVQTNVDDTASSPFPALTICGTHPFSNDAVEHWNSGRILSPEQFNRNLRQIAKHYFKNGSFHLASAMFYYDHVGIYYQNLSSTESYDLGYKPDKFLLYCNLLLETGQQILSSNLSECFLDVTHFSHPKYFNCFSVTVNNIFLNQVKHLGIIVDLGDKTDSSLNPAAFIHDVFDQAVGLRIVLHEPHLRANMENEGSHVEAGTMNEIVYQLEEWHEVNTPKDQCYFKNEEFLLADLKNTFGYDSKTCIDQKVNKLVSERCSCQLSYLPKPLMPSEAIPYCGQISYANMEKIIDRFMCVASMNLTEMKNEIRKNHCKSRCNFRRYLPKVSTTKWKATSWQLYWLVKISGAFRNLFENEMRSDLQSTNGTKDITDYFETENLQSRSSEILTNNLNRYSYIAIKNTAGEIIVKQEIVQMTLSNLFSSLGGLSSLYLGLSCSFFIEILEFFFLSKKMKKSSSKKNNANEQTLL